MWGASEITACVEMLMARCNTKSRNTTTTETWMALYAALSTSQDPYFFSDASTNASDQLNRLLNWPRECKANEWDAKHMIYLCALRRCRDELLTLSTARHHRTQTPDAGIASHFAGSLPLFRFHKASLSVWYREHSERIKAWYTYYCHCILKTWIQGMIRDAKRMKSLENWYLCFQPVHNFDASYWKYCFLAWRADGDPCIQQLLITL